MPKQQKNTKSSKGSVTTRRREIFPRNRAAASRLPLYILAIVAGVMTAALFWFQTRAAGNATLYLSPLSTSVAQNSTVSFEVRMNSSVGVDGAAAYLQYPTKQLEYVTTDTSNSAFPSEAFSSGGEGRVTIMRYASELISGDQLIATVTFKALGNKGSATVGFGSESELTRADPQNPSQYINELGDKNGATVKLSKQNAGNSGNSDNGGGGKGKGKGKGNKK